MARQKPAGWKRAAQLIVNIGLFAVALGVLRHVLTQYNLGDVVESLKRLGWMHLGASLILTILGYGALVGYDFLSLRLARHPIALRRMWAPSFVSHAVQNSAPVSIVAGGGLRYRLFSRLGVTGKETAAVVAGNLLTFVIGLFAVAGLSFVIAPVRVPKSFHIPGDSLRPVGIIFLTLVIAALVVTERGVTHVRVWRWKFDLPRGSLLREQLGVSVADWILSSAALYVLMIAAGPVPWLDFLSAFLLAQIVTQVFPLPGGIGVFEAAILVLRPHGVDASMATAALLVYRVVYYLIPLFAATAILARQASGRPGHATPPAVRAAQDVAPHLFAVLAFVAGTILLVFDALPGRSDGFRWLGHLLQLAVIEGSRFIGSLVGTGMILLAFGLERRLRSAYRFTVGLLIIGIPAALIHAEDLVAATILMVLLLLLLLARHEFNRKIPFNDEPLNAGWVAAALAAAMGVVWLGVFLQVRREYTRALWWNFALDQSAPGALRVGVGVLIGFTAFAVFRLGAKARRMHRDRGRGPTGAKARRQE